MAKEIYDEDTQEWYPEIDLKSPERQFKYREEELRLWGGSLDKELKEIEEFVQQLLNDWPGLEREKFKSLQKQFLSRTKIGIMVYLASHSILLNQI